MDRIDKFSIFAVLLLVVWIIASLLNVYVYQHIGGTHAGWNFFVLLLKVAEKF